ncbi:cilia- and flagella-associated protein 251 [Myripristis murdjan]|uniref:cilia- and flagella-associated protein 251 n=1 Tax=Myripristis murdjan TaxID=586833 RepID=UPI001175FED2|nr:cilia- and flagella-associated protein 251-like [Myripristis murdjan]
MEGEKEREREQGEEKESNEAEEEEEEEEEEEKRSDEDEEEEEDGEEDSEGAALVWQEGCNEDDLGLPIMHWEALSLRIAELEKQEEERREKKSKSGVSLERGRAPVSWMEERGRRVESWEDGDDDCNSHVMTLTSRLQTQMNLQLCFINNSESEEEEEKDEESHKKRGMVQVPKHPQAPAKVEKTKASRGFRNALRSLRDKLRTDHKPAVPVCCDPQKKRRHLELSDLQAFSIKELNALCTSLSQAIQDLSSELVGRLQARDQLRIEQDAMLLEVQDLTSL